MIIFLSLVTLVLLHLFLRIALLTVQLCASYCRAESSSYTYYATQWGKEVREGLKGSPPGRNTVEDEL